MMDRRGLLAGAAALGLAGPALAAGGPAVTLPDVEIPVRVEGNELWTGVWIDGKGPFRFSIDSGNNAFLIWKPLAEKLGLEQMPPTHAEVAYEGRWQLAEHYEARQLLVGAGFNLTRVPLTGFKWDPQPINLGILPLMPDRVTTFDFQAGVMRSLRKPPADLSGFAKAPLVYNETYYGAWTPRLACELGGKKVRLAIVTGEPEALLLYPEIVRLLGLWSDDKPHYDRPRDYGSTHVVERATRGPDLQIGELKVPSPLLTLQKYRNSGALGGGSEIDGYIGMQLLRRLDLVIDQPGRKLWTRPNADFALPWSHDRAGFDVEAKDDQWLVSIVDPGSPAERAGLKVGDRIRTGIESVRSARYASAGAQIGFTVETGGERRKVTMTLEDRV